jgi:hypothetical protein
MPKYTPLIDRALDVVFDGNETTAWNGPLKFYVNGDLAVGKICWPIALAWRFSIVPNDLMPLYDFKCDDPEMSGGILNGAPFRRLSAELMGFGHLDFPDYHETLHLLQTDTFGSPFFITPGHDVIAYSLTSGYIRVGTLDDFMCFCISKTLDKKSWAKCLEDPTQAAEFDLTPTIGVD